MKSGADNAVPKRYSARTVSVTPSTARAFLNVLRCFCSKNFDIFY